MAEQIKREDAGIIASKLNECKNHLQRGNIFSCIVCFEEVVEKMLSTKMLASDEKVLNNEINSFQKNLAASRIFREVYGPVTFRDNDLATSLAFMKQLIQIKEEEIHSIMAERPPDTKDSQEDAPHQEVHDLAQQVRILIEKGDYADAQELIGDNEEIIFLLMEEYNAAGIRYRREGRYDEAISEFKKALVVQPRDEGLFYNISRVFICKKEWKTAAETICEGLRINPQFAEGIKLLKYIRETGGVDFEEIPSKLI